MCGLMCIFRFHTRKGYPQHYESILKEQEGHPTVHNSVTTTSTWHVRQACDIPRFPPCHGADHAQQGTARFYCTSRAFKDRVLRRSLGMRYWSMLSAQVQTVAQFLSIDTTSLKRASQVLWHKWFCRQHLLNINRSALNQVYMLPVFRNGRIPSVT